MATSLQYVSSMARNAGITLDKMIGIIAVGSEENVNNETEFYVHNVVWIDISEIN